MQVISSSESVHPSFNLSRSSATEFAEVASKFEQDFKLKIQLTEEREEAVQEREEDKEEVVDNSHDEEVEEEEEEEDEFSFICTNPDGSPISADDVFLNGQIRPVFPLFNQDLLAGEDKTESSSSLRPPLKKLFLKEPDQPAAAAVASEPDGPFCEWRAKVVDASPEVCKKSNSTGFSKLRRFRELVLRSNSDGKDAFVFLNPNSNNPTPPNPASSTSTKTTTSSKWKKAAAEEKTEKKTGEKTKVVAVGKKKGETASSAHERHYVSNRAMKEGEKRKSYLPYRVGFFTNVNGLSRNVHPF